MSGCFLTTKYEIVFYRFGGFCNYPGLQSSAFGKIGINFSFQPNPLETKIDPFKRQNPEIVLTRLHSQMIEKAKTTPKKKPCICRVFKLSDQDSNLDKQNQNLLCCHYTIGQSGCKNTIQNLFQKDTAQKKIKINPISR
jgi:hypothetical protein